MEFQKLWLGNIFLISDINQNFQKLNSDFSEIQKFFRNWILKFKTISHIQNIQGTELMSDVHYIFFKTSLSDAIAKL